MVTRVYIQVLSPTALNTPLIFINAINPRSQTESFICTMLKTFIQTRNCQLKLGSQGSATNEDTPMQLTSQVATAARLCRETWGNSCKLQFDLWYEPLSILPSVTFWWNAERLGSRALSGVLTKHFQARLLKFDWGECLYAGRPSGRVLTSNKLNHSHVRVHHFTHFLMHVAAVLLLLEVPGLTHKNGSTCRTLVSVRFLLLAVFSRSVTVGIKSP